MLSNHQQTILWDRFQREHRWTLMAELSTLAALGRRWSKAIEMPPEAVEPIVRQEFLVNSASNPDIAYLVDELGCTCPDSTKLTPKSAPYGWCKHRIATWLQKAALDVPTKPEDQIKRELAELYSTTPHPESLGDLHSQRIAEQYTHANLPYRRHKAA